MIPGTVGEAESAATAKLLTATRLRDSSLADHGVRTAHIAAAVGTELGLSRDEIDTVYLGALLHDVGKLGVSEAILWKPGGLDNGEWETIRSHPEHGHRLVADIVSRDVSACVLYHHERVDRDGYPFGADLKALPIAVRIVQAADAYDAMTSDRPYESAVPRREAIAELRRCAGSQFDAEVIAALARIVGETGEPIVLEPAIGPEVEWDPPESPWSVGQ